MTMSALMLNEEELRANVPSNVFQQHKEMERVCGRSGRVELLIVAASFLIFCMGGKRSNAGDVGRRTL